MAVRSAVPGTDFKSAPFRRETVHTSPSDTGTDFKSVPAMSYT